MTRNLRRKLLRDLKANFVQFLAIFIMCFLAMFVLEAFDSVVTGSCNSLDRYYIQTDFADLEATSEGFTTEDLLTVRMLPSVKNAELRYTVNGRARLGGAEKKLEFNYIDGNEISKMLLVSGEPYEKEQSGIWIDSDFAVRQGINVGDTLQLTCEGVDFYETVRGTVSNPEHVYFLIDGTYIEPDIGGYGYAFLDAGEYPGESLLFDTMYVDVYGVEHQYYLTDEEKAAIDGCRQDITQAISKTSLAFTAKQKQTGYDSIAVDVGSYKTLRTFFPAIFMMIAVLGIVTTMTRLVTKQRTVIGTLKALGFSNVVVMIHYVSYSVVIALTGAILGAVAGWYTLGASIFDSMKAYYCIPGYSMEVSGTVVITIVLIPVIAGVTNYMACRKLLVQRASEILRPEPPAVMGAGLLEKTPLWSKMNFATRWNLRDVNRNRLRTIAAVLGVLQCAMLLYTAFGVNELNKSVENWEYSELSPANYTVTFSAGTDYGTVYDYARQYSGQMVQSAPADLISGDDSGLYRITVVDEGNLYRFQAENGDYTKLPDHGVAISKRAADRFGIAVGDTMGFRMPPASKVYNVKVRLIYKAPNSQGIAMKRSCFEELGADFRPDTLYTDMTVPFTYVNDRTEIASVFSKEQYIRSMKAKGASFDYSVLYIMVIAVAIGIVVMYNLGILSFIEKVREIATLKVLGFPTNKIRWILQQQNIFITGIGTAIGLALGPTVLEFMMAEVDVDADYMYSRMSPMPYVYAFALSFILSIAVNSIISSKVKDIDMVEALKGVE